MKDLVILTIGFAAALVASRAAAEPPHVTCVGDSITFGAGTSNAATKSYPAVLQTLLTTEFAVENDGHSGATLLHNGDLPYLTTAEYTASTTWAAAGGDVVIQLGTNDTKPQNWANKASFEADCESLVDHYLGASKPPPRVWVNLIPPIFTNGYGIDPTLVDPVLALLRQCATAKGVSTIDVHAALANQSAHLADGVHPDDVGAALIAQAVHDALVKQPAITIDSAAQAVVATTPIVAYGTAIQVEIFDDGNASLGKATAPPWTVNVPGLALGSHVIHAVLTESDGRTASSAPTTYVLTADAGTPTSIGAPTDAGTAAATAPNDSPSGCAATQRRTVATSAFALTAIVATLAWLRRRKR